MFSSEAKKINYSLLAADFLGQESSYLIQSFSLTPSLFATHTFVKEKEKAIIIVST